MSSSASSGGWQQLEYLSSHTVSTERICISGWRSTSWLLWRLAIESVFWLWFQIVIDTSKFCYHGNMLEADGMFDFTSDGKD